MELENTETVETTEEVAPEILDAEIVEETVEEVAEEEKPEEVDEVTEEPVEEVVEEKVELPVLDMASPTVIDDAKNILEKYEIPAEMQVAIDALVAKTDDPLAEYADYGDVDAIKTLLDRQNLLISSRPEGDGYRPNTDKFIATLPKERLDYLYYDIASQPSTQYQGLSKFEETIVNTYGTEGENVGAVLAKYQQFVQAMQSGIITSDVPTFIPSNLQEAYYKLSPTTRNEIALLDPEFEQESINNKLAELTLIQKGIDGEKKTIQQTLQEKQQSEQNFQQTVQTTQLAFYDSFRTQFAQDLAKEVTFSTDPKMQTMLANQQVALLTQAFDDGSTGEFARNTLKDAGINFDYTKAQSLMKTVEQAAVTLTTHERAVNADGKPLDEIALNKARSEFKKAGLAWQSFASDILKQEAALVSTGKKEDVKQEVAKQKVAVKARITPNGNPTQAKKTETLPLYGTEDWDRYFAKKTLDEQAQRARQYSS